MSEKPDEIEHGVAEACYSGGTGEPYYQPFMLCLCGEFRVRDESWEDVGRAMDEHIRKTKP